MKTELNENEMRSLIESVITEKQNYENNAMKYLSESAKDSDSPYHVKDYRQSIFLPTIKKFDERLEKLRKIRDEMAEERRQKKK